MIVLQDWVDAEDVRDASQGGDRLGGRMGGDREGYPEPDRCAGERHEPRSSAVHKQGVLGESPLRSSVIGHLPVANHE